MKPKIAIIGDTCIDKTILGCVKRISPEAPVPIFTPLKETNTLGMAGNVFENLKSLSMGEYDIDFYFDTGPSIVKTRFVDEASGYMLLRVDENDKQNPIRESDLKKIKETDYKAVVISDYGKGFLSEENIREISENCKTRNIPTFLDTKKYLYEWSKDITFVKVNQLEYERLLKNRKPNSYCQNLIVTKGGEGSTEVKTNIHVPGIKIEVRDPCGCGDTYLAALALAYLRLKDITVSSPITTLNYIMHKANQAAAICASHHGVVAVNGKLVW